MARRSSMMIRDLIEQRPPASVALLAPGRPPLTYAALLSESSEIAGALSARGIGAGDRLAIVLPNGAEMAVAFLACASVCTTAPLTQPIARRNLLSISMI